MNICLLVLTDGRDDLLAQTINSARDQLRGPITRRVIHTDNGPEHVFQLRTAYPEWEVIGGERQGFGGAIDRAWRYVSEGPEQYVWHLEDDFIFRRSVPLNGMMQVMEQCPRLVQIALRRQPWNPAERKAGGIVEQWPKEYTEYEWQGYHWLEHRLFLTTNPSLWHMERCKKGWPNLPTSERLYSDMAFLDLQAQAGFWGTRESGEWCLHIGEKRVGKGY